MKFNFALKIALIFIVTAACLKKESKHCQAGTKITVQRGSTDPNVHNLERHLIGGYLSIDFYEEFNQMGVGFADYIKEHLDGTGDSSFNSNFVKSYYDKTCTFNLDFTDQSHFILWTAKHCLFSNSIKSLQAFVYLSGGYKAIPLSIDVIDQNRAYLEQLNKDTRLAFVYNFYVTSFNWEANQHLPVWQSATTRLVRQLRQEAEVENLVFGRELCQSPNEQNKFEFQGKKICYLNADLVAVTGQIKTDSLNKKIKPLISNLIASQLDYQTLFRGTNKDGSQLLKMWRRHHSLWADLINLRRLYVVYDTLHNLCAVNDQAKKDFTTCANPQEFETLTLEKIAEVAKSIDETKLLSTRLGVFLDNKTLDFSFSRKIEDLILENANSLSDIWMQFVQNYVTLKDLYLTGNYKNSQSDPTRETVGLYKYYASPFDDLKSPSKKRMSFLRSYGLVDFVADDSYLVFPKDSGAQLSWLGLFPIAGLSSVNDINISGGAGITVLPDDQNIPSKPVVSVKTKQPQSTPKDQQSPMPASESQVLETNPSPSEQISAEPIVENPTRSSQNRVLDNSENCSN